jgi:orotate phosphoribosyltransferase
MSLNLKSEFAKDFSDRGVINKGFFKLSSGLLSEYYLQCARIFEDSKFAETLCKNIATKINSRFGVGYFDLVVSPAMGGLFFGYELSRSLGIRNVFVERKDNIFTLARGFEIKPGQKILICEDVVTTAKSSIEAINVVRGYSPSFIAEVCIFKRGEAESIRNHLDCELIYLEELNITTFDENNIPPHLIGKTPIKPGSRKI